MGCCYNFVWALLRFILYIFIYERNVSGEENIPKRGAVIFAGNHPNGLVDPAVLLASCPRTLHFMAKAPLFKPLCGLMGKILRSCGAIPVYRAQDGGGGSNDAAFRAVDDLLSREKCFAIFPEGVSHADSEIRELKSGVSRMALAFAAKHPDTPLTIVPTGLTYTEGHRFRTSLSVKFGEGFRIPPELIAEYKGVAAATDDGTPSAVAEPNIAQQKEAVKKLTQIIAASIRRYTINAQDWRTVELVLLSVQLYRPPLSAAELRSGGEHSQQHTLSSACCTCWCCGAPSFDDDESPHIAANSSNRDFKMHIGKHLHLASLFAARYEDLREQPVMQVFRSNVEEYGELLSRLRMTDDDVRYYRRVPMVELVLTSLFYLVVLLILLPLSLPGIIYSLPIALPARFLGRKAAKKGGRDVLATFKLMIAFVLTPLVYGTYIGIASWQTAKHTDTNEALAGYVLAYCIAFPLVGILGLRFLEEGGKVFTYWRKICMMVGVSTVTRDVTNMRLRLHRQMRALVVLFHKQEDKKVVVDSYGATFSDDMTPLMAKNIVMEMMSDHQRKIAGSGSGTNEQAAVMAANNGTAAAAGYGSTATEEEDATSLPLLSPDKKQQQQKKGPDATIVHINGTTKSSECNGASPLQQDDEVDQDNQVAAQYGVFNAVPTRGSTSAEDLLAVDTTPATPPLSPREPER